MLESDPTMPIRLQELIDSGGLPPAYHEHPVVTSNPGELVLPCALYMDGVAYSTWSMVQGG